ncbi:hypothetical protein BK006_02450 [bacterium CG10_49_38]|nr:MAG: hypothetical protein BK006_02450 [bacterium CG10_49_38]
MKEKGKREKPKILITGGLSFIFSYVTEYFVKKGWEVTVIDNCSVGSNPHIYDGSFTLHKVDFCTKKGYEIAVREDPDYFIHAAARTDVDYSILHPLETLKNNALSTFNAFEAARAMDNLHKFMYVATDEVYGDHNKRKDEQEALDPRNPYSSSKAIGSLMRKSYENTYPQLANKIVELRSCNCFGHRQDVTKIIPQLIRSAITGQVVPIHNEGRGYREFIYVENIPTIVELLLQEGTGVYNVSGYGITVRNLVKKVQKVLGVPINTTPATRVGMDEYYKMDDTRLRLLGWRPRFAFEKGLRLTYEKTEKALGAKKRSSKTKK